MIQGNCYLLTSTKQFWASSITVCNLKSSHLATIMSSSELVEISDALPNILQNRVWIGLNDIQKEGSWVWVDGSFSSYRNWGLNQPDNTNGNEDCAVIVYGGVWEDVRCSRVLHALCKYNPALQGITTIETFSLE